PLTTMMMMMMMMTTRIEAENTRAAIRRVHGRGYKQLTPTQSISNTEAKNHRLVTIAMIVCCRGCSSTAERRFPNWRWGFDSLRPLQFLPAVCEFSETPNAGKLAGHRQCSGLIRLRKLSVARMCRWFRGPMAWN